MARGFSGEVASVELMEQGVCNVVHGNTVSQRAAYARRLAAAGLTLLVAIVVCAALVGSSAPSASQVNARARASLTVRAYALGVFAVPPRVRPACTACAMASWQCTGVTGVRGRAEGRGRRRTQWALQAVDGSVRAAVSPCRPVALLLCVGARQLSASKLYSATGWDAIYGGGGGASSNSDGWADSSGSDDTGARTNSLHQTWGDDSDSSSDDSDVDPDSAKNDVHWNAAGGATSKTALSDDSSTDDASSSVAGQTKGGKASSSSGSSSKASAKSPAAKKGKPDTTDALLKLSKVAHCASAHLHRPARVHASPIGGFALCTCCRQRCVSWPSFEEG